MWEDIGAPMDVLWFKVGKPQGSAESIFARVQSGQMMVMLDRTTYWQCAYIIAKNGFETVKAKGLDSFRDNIVKLAPIAREHIGDIKGWDDVKLLSVKIDRLTRWARQGFLCIGDAAHAMSPVGGVGVNLAVQDAVATANLLFDKFGSGGPMLANLDYGAAAAAVSRQGDAGDSGLRAEQAHHRAITDKQFDPPFVLRIVGMIPFLQGLTARAIGIGVRPEHVHSIEAKSV